MTRPAGLVVIWILLITLAGCGSTADASLRTVEESASTVSTVRHVVELSLEGRMTDQTAQVALQDSVEALAEAHRELVTADGVPGERAGLARQAIAAAIDAVSELGMRPGSLGPDDLTRLDAVAEVVARAAEQLR